MSILPTINFPTNNSFCIPRTGIFLVPWVNKTTKHMIKNIMPTKMNSANNPLAPDCTIVISLRITFGNADTIPTMIIRDMPLPIPLQ